MFHLLAVSCPRPTFSSGLKTELPFSALGATLSIYNVITWKVTAGSSSWVFPSFTTFSLSVGIMDGKTEPVREGLFYPSMPSENLLSSPNTSVPFTLRMIMCAPGGRRHRLSLLVLASQEDPCKKINHDLPLIFIQHTSLR